MWNADIRVDKEETIYTIFFCFRVTAQKILGHTNVHISVKGCANQHSRNCYINTNICSDYIHVHTLGTLIHTSNEV